MVQNPIIYRIIQNLEVQQRLWYFAGFFGKEAIDEDAVEMLGSLPIDRAMSILTNIEENSQQKL